MDYREVVRTLRAKAESTEFPAEAKALKEKADELEARYTVTPTVERVTITFVHPETQKWVTRTYGFPDDWYDTIDNWADTSDWYSGAEY